MIPALKGDVRGLHASAAIAFVMASILQTSLLAQGLNDPEAIDTIIGSGVSVEELRSDDDVETVLAALDHTSANIAEVRKRFTLDDVQIVFLPDIGSAVSPIGRKVEENREEIAELQQAIEGSAMFYHAVDSHSIRVSDVVAVEFDDANGVKIYAAGEASDQ